MGQIAAAAMGSEAGAVSGGRGSDRGGQKVRHARLGSRRLAHRFLGSPVRRQMSAGQGAGSPADHHERRRASTAQEAWEGAPEGSSMRRRTGDNS